MPMQLSITCKYTFIRQPIHRKSLGEEEFSIDSTARKMNWGVRNICVAVVAVYIYVQQDVIHINRLDNELSVLDL